MYGEGAYGSESFGAGPSAGAIVHEIAARIGAGADVLAPVSLTRDMKVRIGGDSALLFQPAASTLVITERLILTISVGGGTSHDIGDAVDVFCSFTRQGVVVDPPVVKCTFLSPVGVEIPFTYLAAGSERLVRLSPANYRCTALPVDNDESGVWVFRWASEDPLAAAQVALVGAQESTFYVRRSAFVLPELP